MNTSTKILLGLTVAVVVVALGGLITSRSQTASIGSTVETTHVRIADLPVTHGLPFYVALDKGYFKDVGIDVERIKVEAPNQIIDALLSGSVDFSSTSGALGIVGIANHKNPGKLSVYAVSGDSGKRSGHSLVVQPDSHITSIEKLRGSRLGILAGTIQWRTIAREILEKNGLDMSKDLTIVELAPTVQVSALASKQVDALLTLEPVPTIATQHSVGKVLVQSPAQEYIASPFWYGAGIVRTEFVKNNPKTTAKVLAVIRRAMQEIEQDPQAARQYLKGNTALTDDLIATVPLPRFVMYDQMTEADKDAVQKFYDIFTKWGVVSGRMDFRSLLYSSQ